MEAIKPSHYRFTTSGGHSFDLIDLFHNFPIDTLPFLAFRYLRTKGNADKKRNDIEKCLEVLSRFESQISQPIERLGVCSLHDYTQALPKPMGDIYIKFLAIHHCNNDTDKLKLIQEARELIETI